MKLNDFITMKEPWAYNFEFECGDEEYKKLETFMRYFIYKMQPEPPAFWLKNTAKFIKKNYGYCPVYDPDGSSKYAYYQIVIEIYKSLWNWKCPANPEQRRNERVDFAEVDENIFGRCLFGPDTMNSVQTPLSLVVGVENNSLRETLNECYDPNMNAVNININGLADYIDWYHTLGNLVLGPAGFNQHRAMNEEIKDFWGPSLNCLKKNGYKENVRDHWDCNKHKYIYRPVVFDKCKFNEYINYFFLWDYVEHKDNGYIVKRISHKDCGSEQSQFSPDFFAKTQEIIERRGRFMTAMLMLEQDNPDLYKDIQGWFVAKNDNGELPFFDGMNDVVGKILEKFSEKIPENAKEILKELSSWKLHEKLISKKAENHSEAYSGI